MISLASPFLLLFTIPIGIIYTPIARKFLSVQRSLKRLESGSRSPIYSAFGESLQGAVTIRAFGKTDVWMSQMMETLDVNHRAFLPLWAANRWLAGRVETVGALVAFGTGLSIAFAVSERGGGVRMDPGWAGLLLNYSGMFTDVLTWLVRNSAQMEMTMTSVERLLEYTKLKQERPAVVENYPVPESWPTNGSVAFDHLGIQYQTNEDRIQIAAGESVGVVGRTGSGKSTLGMSLVRFEEYAHGTVWIDGVDIAVIGLKYLRQKLVVVPQDPFLFQGTVQLNLDPTSSYTPSEIENAFRFVTDSSKISNSGTNLSSGQKQLISLARAVLRKQSFGNRDGVIVFDEATASLDASSERVVQAVIDKLVVGDGGQRKWTSITIAHRLETVMGLDRVIVLSGGKVVEDGNPRALVKSGNGAFFDLFSK
ncbi:multidrug resistance-associated protein 14 [Rhizoclosmatium globosum]|uniref:Multidrug resistance-associated protein 14 n=1 Tax=Rhizoclosmatium globosum TaxID=329046 RepID=A0A1Y2C7W2_9FUNG|nr:multidrug resistance-associated protein 14 [Rhizoclosmatium globosum]|eukprot:ORY43122.1 multidrug resistance-associated protein 14 [Rhizoclosmatium globosum]